MFWWAIGLGSTFLICIIAIGCIVSCKREKQRLASEQYAVSADISGNPDEDQSNFQADKEMVEAEYKKKDRRKR